jgi:hypothetical protein
MHFELWGVHSGNLIAKSATDVEAYRIVRELLAAGWDPENLLLAAELDPGDSEDRPLPPVLEGAVLKERAHEYA